MISNVITVEVVDACKSRLKKRLRRTGLPLMRVTLTVVSPSTPAFPDASARQFSKAAINSVGSSGISRLLNVASLVNVTAATAMGACAGALVGARVVGRAVGALVGKGVGGLEGGALGKGVGDLGGKGVGSLEGEALGKVDGTLVGE